jgi:4-diphosphocytidyl-2-C-methyl-D-erythritol kinase
MVVFPVAKINLGLYVTSRRDDGYHNIETLFYPIGFSDVLEVVPDPKVPDGTIDLTLSGLNVEGPAESNLVVKAYRLLNDRAGLSGVRVFLHKCIPTGAGLGGGSSDGASMLLVLNRLFDLDLSYCDLFDLALKLGSDCPYFLDPIPSFAQGRGEEMSLSNVSLKGKYLLLFHPGTGISTTAAYRAVKTGKPQIRPDLIGQIPVEEWKGLLENVFEPYAFEMQPVIGQIKARLYDSGALFASMTGSGSAVYGLFSVEPMVPEQISPYLVWKERL